jgi:hypothetical protein
MQERVWYVLPAMARAKRARRSNKPRPPKRRVARRATAPRETPRSPAETGLLSLARALTELTTSEPPAAAALTSALAMLASAFAPDAALTRALARARHAALGDEARALALAWAREQLRLSLGEILARAAAAGELRVGLPADSLAWLLLAGCEALGDEPHGAVPDRVKLLASWLHGE